VVYNHSVLAAALSSGKLRAALARAFKCTPASLALDPALADTLAILLQKRVLERLGLELKAGFLISGADKVLQAVRAGTCDLVLHVRDASKDGKRKLKCADVRAMTLPLERDALSLSLGRDNVVHLGLIEPKAAQRVVLLLEHWLAYLGQNTEDEDGSNAACALSCNAGQSGNTQKSAAGAQILD
jgi:hypothetical protein